MNADRPNTVVVLLCALSAACSGAEDPAAPANGPWSSGFELPAGSPKAPGDAVLGRELLLEGGFMTCGVPLKLWSDPTLGPLVQSSLGSLARGEPLPGRSGRNAEMPFGVNAFVAADGAEVVNLNCTSCHAGKFDGEL